MTICYFGDYNPEYARTKVILKGLSLENVKVIHCNVRGTKGWELLWQLYKTHQALREPYDVLFVGVGDSRIVPLLARLIARAKVVWEPLFSIYDNFVFDRKLTSPHSPKALWYWLIDWLDCRAAHLIVLDTKTNAEYFHYEFNVPMKKLGWIYIGADDDVFKEKERPANVGIFEVEFHGKYIPVQGAEVIVRGAKLLEEQKTLVHFTMIGSGQDRKRVEALAQELGVTSMTFLPFLTQQEITEYVARANVCIGLIGDVPRVKRAIPNKLYEAAAMSRVSINADTPALRELFTPGENVVAIPQGDHEALARAITELLRDPQKADVMGRKAKEVYLQWGTNKSVGRQAAAVLLRIIDSF